jgi:hypothetical protein
MFHLELLPFALIWTGCLAYFFGFFGISFLDTEALSKSPSNHELGSLQKKKIIVLHP